MTRGGKVLSVMLVVLLGLWGCARGPVGQSAQGERLRSLESTCEKLKDDYRSVASARDQLRKKVDALEAERLRLQQDLADKKAVVKERDDLRQQVTARTSERDNLQLRCDRIKKGLQSLLGQDDAMLPTPAAPTATNTNTNTTLALPTQS
jgi:septal ring factor EnvC (AmiA/AmiB activator)